jgi:hypothetical protein
MALAPGYTATSSRLNRTTKKYIIPTATSWMMYFRARTKAAIRKIVGPVLVGNATSTPLHAVTNFRP